MKKTANKNRENSQTEHLIPEATRVNGFSNAHRLDMWSIAEAQETHNEDHDISPFAGNQSELNLTSVTEVPSTSIRYMPSVNDFVEQSDDFLVALQSNSTVKIGSFTILDSEASRAFSNNKVLARGFPTLRDSNWKNNWREEIHNKNKRWCSTTSVAGVCIYLLVLLLVALQLSFLESWSEQITVSAYAVTIKDITRRRRGALLSMLLAKSQTGALSKNVWEIPTVQALITYHWRTWAYPYLMFQLVLFSIWCAALIGYLILYIEYDMRKAIDGDSMKTHLDVCGLSYLFNILCFVPTCPFACLEVLTIWKQKSRWISSANILDVSVIVLQILFFTWHIMKFGVGERWYSGLLTIHTMLMFTKLQDFGRLLGSGASFIQRFLYVLYDVRYFIVFIVMTIITMGLCCGTLYKNDKYNQDHVEFTTVHNSIVATFSMLFGYFNTAYIFSSEHPVEKSFFFFGINMLMTVTIMNLLIAVMSQSYSERVKDQLILTYMNQASVIEELQALKIPQFCMKKFDSFVHFLVIEQDNINFPASHPLKTSMSNTNTLLELENLSAKVDVRTSLPTKIIAALEKNQPQSK